MKKIVLGLVLALLLSGNAYALNFSPLSKYTKEDWKDPSKLIYIYQRCGAVMAYAAQRVKASNNVANKTDIVDVHTRISTFFVAQATTVHEMINNYNFAKSYNRVISIVEKLISSYAEDSEKIYLQTGNYLGESINKDLTFCTGVYSRSKIK